VSDEYRITLEFTDPEVALEWLRRAHCGGDRVRLGRRVRTNLPMTARVVGGFDGAQAELEDELRARNQEDPTHQGESSERSDGEEDPANGGSGGGSATHTSHPDGV